MRPSRNAFIGYTYQEQITFLFLVMMDVERKFNTLEIEADIDNNFDDIKIFSNKDLIYFQIKDFDKIGLSDLGFFKSEISIKGKKHTLSDNGMNVIVFKNIDIETNSRIFGLPALKRNNIYIISLSRMEADDLVNEFYIDNEKRKIIINRFFNDCLDNRVLKIKRGDLPIIDVFETKLLEETIHVGKKHLEFSNILLIEGKPGIGKSHYVNYLSEVYDNKIVYRFWTSNQDKDYKSRLVYKNFIDDFSKKLFGDYVIRNESEIIDKIRMDGLITIIDGLDHVENYNNGDLEKFIKFVDNLKVHSKTIVLSRPLKFNLKWKKQTLTNWNNCETHKVLNELYHISEYEVCEAIFNITDGYPILVRFMGEHFKAFKNIPPIEKLKGVDDYYRQILKDVNTKTALTLFLTSRSFFMKSELAMFLSDDLLDCVHEFINAYPYLFETRLNRISLFHDSLNKYLRELNINPVKRKSSVNTIVYQSILKEETRFMSRFSYFDLEREMKLEIIKKFTSIKLFQKIAKDCIDFEALRSFYIQIRESLNDISHSDLEIINYYDLALISNIVIRDQILTLNEFLYTYTKCLLFHGYSIEYITSSEYLFGMFTYVQENDSTLLYNITSDSNYDTTRFLEELENDVYTEETFFEIYEEAIKLSKPIDYYLGDDYKWREYLTQILTNLYIHRTSDESLLALQNCIVTFIDISENKGVWALERIFLEKNLERRFPIWVLNDVRKNLMALGKLPGENPYLISSLKNYIIAYSWKGSFDMWPNILGYLRLSLKRNEKIDISSIGLFWCMYYKRKDYTVINMDVALKVFEENGLIGEETSIKKVVFAQSMSEKGIRHLLTDYISNRSPEIIEKVLDGFSKEDLNISWFDLPPKHINNFPEKLFNYATNTLLTYHRHNKQLDFNAIKNVFYSSKWMDLLEDLKLLKYKIRIPESSRELKKLKKYDIAIISFKEDIDKPNTSDYRYNNGILDSRDIKYIIDNDLSLTEISGYLDGNYAALADLDVFKIYPKKDVSKHLKRIFYNAILGKVNSINSLGNLFYFIGNLPRLVNDYGVKSDICELYVSFDVFLELSLLND